MCRIQLKQERAPLLLDTMPFTAFHAVEKDTTELLLSLHMVATAQQQQEAWEEAVAVATADLLTGDAAEYGLAQVG